MQLDLTRVYHWEIKYKTNSERTSLRNEMFAELLLFYIGVLKALRSKTMQFVGKVTRERFLIKNSTASSWKGKLATMCKVQTEQADSEAGESQRGGLNGSRESGRSVVSIGVSSHANTNTRTADPSSTSLRLSAPPTPWRRVNNRKCTA